VLEARVKAAEDELARQEYDCSKRFVVNSCVKSAKSAFFLKQQKLDKDIAALNTRERQYEASERNKQRSANLEDQAARASATPAPTQSKRARQSAEDAAASEAAYKAKQADAKQRRADQEAKIKRAAPAPKPPLVPRSADVAAMAAADAKEQARQKDIAVRKAAIDKKRAQPQGTPLLPDPPIR
jgi:hypothetical protein